MFSSKFGSKFLSAIPRIKSCQSLTAGKIIFDSSYFLQEAMKKATNSISNLKNTKIDLRASEL